MASLIVSSSSSPTSHLTLSTPSTSYLREFSCFNVKVKSKSKKNNNISSKRRNAIVKLSSLDEAITDLPDISIPEISKANTSLKLKLLSAVSGLNRGLAASEDDLRKADDAAKELEAGNETVDLTTDLEKLQGKWKLIYSSAFSSRSLGGSRPGPSLSSVLPITLGQVFQRIDVESKDFDNIVEIKLGTPWPIPPIELTATFEHKFELEGTSKVKIIFQKTTVKAKGNLSQLPLLEIPRLPDALRDALRQSSNSSGRGDFEVTYVDSDIRITRGDKGELRVFVIA